MTEAAIAITKLLMYAAMMGSLGEPEVGVGAFYAEGLMQRVCEHRTEMGWASLNCSWPCLVAGIEQDTVGEWRVVDLPGGSVHLCLVVDCGAKQDLEALRGRNEVVEVSWDMAQEANWTGYTDGVRVWRLAPSDEMWYNEDATDGRGFFDVLERGHAGHVYR